MDMNPNNQKFKTIKRQENIALTIFATVFLLVFNTTDYIYAVDGSLDLSLDGDGIVTTPIGIGDDEAYGVAIQSDNKIVVTGRSEQGGTFDTTMVRYEVTSVSSSGGNADPGGGGGCTMNPRGEFDSTLVSLFTLILVYFSWKVFRQHQKNR